MFNFSIKKNNKIMPKLIKNLTYQTLNLHNLVNFELIFMGIVILVII